MAERVCCFLKEYPSFNMLESKRLLQVSAEVNIMYLEKGNTLFNKGDNAHEQFYIVRDDAIYIYHK